jgi:hypothetical protein
MAYASAEGGGGYGVDASIIHFDPAHADHIRVPDAELLFRGEYQRLGPDLVVTGPDGRHHIIPGYFSSEKHPALVAPSGASLTPDVVDLLAGSPTPGQYAQVQPTTPADSIGKVEKVIGSVTVVRNGVAVALHVGDAVYKSDVVQTGANSSAASASPTAPRSTSSPTRAWRSTTIVRRQRHVEQRAVRAGRGHLRLRRRQGRP